MCDCESAAHGGGPFSSGRALVEFVLAAHGGEVAAASLPSPLRVSCQGCGKSFLLQKFVQACPACGGVHAISPPRVDDPAAVQFAGQDFVLPRPGR